jgi:hypothetical protein
MAEGFEGQGHVSEPEEIARILSSMSAAQAAVQVTLASRKRRFKGRLIHMEGSTIVAEVDTCAGIGKLTAATFCQVDCSTPTMSCQFASYLRDYESLGVYSNLIRLRIALPKSLSHDQNREVFRVPVSGDSGLAVKVKVGESYLAGIPRDVSFAGVCVSFPDAEDPRLEIGQEVDMRTSFCGWYALDVKAIVQWCKGTTYGLMIPDFLCDGEFAPPPQWLEVLHGLQLKWSALRTTA